MTPSEFMQQYRELAVHSEDGHDVTVDVHAYMINAPGKHSTAKALEMWHTVKSKLGKAAKHHRLGYLEPVPVVGSIGAAVQMARGAIVPADRHEEMETVEDLHLIERDVKAVPYGKGSPSEVATYLDLAIRAGVASSATLQRFADDRYVGLDCSGFVTNYMVAIGKMEPVEALGHNAASFASGHEKRLTMDSLKNLDVMVWADGHHVAIMEEPDIADGKATCVLVESNGHRGLDSEEYSFESVDKHGLFKVKRVDGSIHQAHVFNWNLTV